MSKQTHVVFECQYCGEENPKPRANQATCGSPLCQRLAQQDRQEQVARARREKARYLSRFQYSEPA